MGVPAMLQANAKDKTTNADLLAQIAALQAENQKLKEARNAKLSMKVSGKGALSLYGLGRFPITLYSGQWERVLAMADQIRSFMAENKDKLATKE